MLPSRGLARLRPVFGQGQNVSWAYRLLYGQLRLISAVPVNPTMLEASLEAIRNGFPQSVGRITECSRVRCAHETTSRGISGRVSLRSVPAIPVTIATAICLDTARRATSRAVTGCCP